MKSPSAVLLGRQTPTYDLVPRAARSDADDAAYLAGSYGMAPDEWQHLVLSGWLGIRADGRWAATRRGLALARQNGKNGTIEQDQLYKLTQLARKILHTAHEVKTARKAFLRLESYFTNRRQFPELADLVKEIRRTNGQEAIVLRNGASCEFVARSRGSGRGFTVDDLYCDEAQELTDEQLAALRPTISAAPSGMPQLTLTGTPPPPALANQVFARMRAEAQAGAPDGRLCWHEWAVEGEPDLSDPQVWATANPGLGIRLDEETVADELADMDDETFKRERLGMWRIGGRQPVILAGTWDGLLEAGSVAGSRVAFGIAVDHEHRRTTIGVAGERSDGLVHVGIAAREPATAWVPQWAKERDRKWRPAAWALNPAAPAGHLISPLVQVKLEPLLLSGREWAAACGGMYTAVAERQIRHVGNPDLAVAVDGATKRPLADAWQWHPADPSVDITPIQAVTLALAGLGHRKARKPKTGRVMAA